MKILLADDHTLFREMLVDFIERTEPGSQVITAKDIHDVMNIFEAGLRPDLLILDMLMPGMQGLQGLEMLQKKYPETRVALISGLAAPEDVDRAIAMGARGYFPKTMSGKAMIAGMRQIINGHVFIARDHNTNAPMPSHFGIIPQKISEVSAASFDAIEKLTPREREVMTYLMRGMANKEIARVLGLQEVTIKLHVRGICRKLHAKNRTQAVLIAQGGQPNHHLSETAM